MRKLNFLSLVAAAAMVLSVGATTVSAEGMKCGAGKCGNSKKEMKRDNKCGDSKKEMQRDNKCGDSKKEMQRDSKCGDSKKEMKRDGKRGDD
ncbi:hypothetical protein [Sulfurimonas sp.]|jgi:hypothetical protein|uniref:hypothetical protein n=1 Tax=Sulfurimonas sp. TaxID=2022749 RepID=UPI0026008CA9|nr:hypothetical protein [Sulfurimonas sp.]MCK9473435.1 hypothetical protein [Sulfurimonas sp.]